MIMRDEEYIVAVLSARTVKEAAETIGVSKRTMARKLSDPNFRAKLNELSAEYIGLAFAPLNLLLTKAVKRLSESLDSGDEKVRLRAIEITFNQASRYMISIEYGNRLRRLEDFIEALLSEKEASIGGRS